MTNTISYSTNFMRPITLKWYEDRGLVEKGTPYWSETLQKEVSATRITKDYCCGRIDIYGSPDSLYNEEISVPVMSADSWNKLSLWLDGYYTEEIDWDVINTFQEQTGHTVDWWED